MVTMSQARQACSLKRVGESEKESGIQARKCVTKNAMWSRTPKKTQKATQGEQQQSLDM